MTEKYSLAFIPDLLIIEKLKQMKNQLAEKIGWFHSKNAIAHITVCEFELDATAITSLQLQLTQIAKGIQPVKVTLTDLGAYPNGAFFIQPDLESKLHLKSIMQKFTSRLKLPNMYKSNDPHLSIARKLSDSQIAMAHELFILEVSSFLCDSIALRQFNLVKKQYEIIATFPFLDDSSQKIIQTSLF
ncbi:2'-5' RNA ligase [Flavobacterium sp. 9AF]|uniref:2'-5' RNA ligase family protein n=1 Tax=Flavobacterium sp. 9AF TaxID=2653142 RepID=UPI0012F28789|nr:2'-5' RNA ligase family protein [Flavobacterium sp. 9AF]VXC27861.1 2'-5' RNA ligase [Flavobacterium sp. 9AF]